MDNPFFRPFESFEKAKAYLAGLEYSTGEFLDFRLEIVGIQRDAAFRVRGEGASSGSKAIVEELPSSCWNGEAVDSLFMDLCKSLEQSFKFIASPGYPGRSDLYR